MSHNGKLQGVVVGYIQQEGGFLKRFFTKRAIIPGGALLSPDISKEALSLLLSTMKKQLKRKAIYIEFRNYNDYKQFIKLIHSINELPAKSNFKLGTGKGHTLKEVARIIETILGKKTNINWGGKAYRNSDVMYAVADRILALRVIKWKPNVKFEYGIEKYIKKNS